MITLKIEIVNKCDYNWEEYLRKFCQYGGIMEASPTFSLKAVAKPSLAFLIEPDGQINYICSYDNCNHNIFYSIAAISPQSSSPKLVKFI